ncbi:hypothetical protein ACFX2F_008460 [Malus domestica]
MANAVGRRHHGGVPDEYLALLPLFQRVQACLGSTGLSPQLPSKLRPCLEESWPVILQAIALDTVPVNIEENEYSNSTPQNKSRNSLLSGHRLVELESEEYNRMVELESEEYQFLWGFALLVLFQGQILPLVNCKV